MVDPSPASVRERIEKDDLFFDSGIVSHGFAPFLRDYDVVIDVPASIPDGIVGVSSSGSYIMGRYRYRFTHCHEALARTTIEAARWRRSWDDVFTDRKRWESAGEPAGFVWGVAFVEAYPGMSYVESSERALHWAEALGQSMHEVRIETNIVDLRIVFHELRVDQLAVGDPATGALTELP